LNRFNSWIHYHEIQWRYKWKLQHQYILIWHKWSIIKSSQYLVWSEWMCMMIRMSLYSEGQRRADRTPWMRVINAFINSVCIFLSSQSIVFQIVHHFQPENSCYCVK
jgi:hypothetical protein